LDFWAIGDFHIRCFSGGNQPYPSDDTRYVMVYNGEIYNYKDFYRTKSNGFTIKQIQILSSIKIIPTLWFKNAPSKWMFAFAIWDKLEKKLTVVKDRMGVKPLILFYL
jgi:asparagine synthase (glutamine-hydrolysing)